MKRLINTLSILGIAIAMTTATFATTQPVEAGTTTTSTAATETFLYDMSDVGTVKDNVAVIGGQIVTPEGKGIPNISITVALYKTASKYDEKRFGVIYTDDKGFWKLYLDKNEVGYTELLVDGTYNDEHYFGGIVPKAVEYEGFITASVQDLLTAKMNKTVVKPRKVTTAMITDKYGNYFVYANSNYVTVNPVTNYYSRPIEFTGYTSITEDMLPIKDTSKVKDNKVTIQPTTPIKTYTGKLSIGDKQDFKDYWVLATPKDDGNTSMYIKVLEDGSFKIDNLKGDMIFKVVKVDENFKQIEAYSPINLKISEDTTINLVCSPNQYMVRIVGELRDCVLDTNISGNTGFIIADGKSSNLGKCRMKDYSNGIVLPMDERGIVRLNYKDKSQGIAVVPTKENPIVEVNVQDLIK